MQRAPTVMISIVEIVAKVLRMPEILMDMLLFKDFSKFTLLRCKALEENFMEIMSAIFCPLWVDMETCDFKQTMEYSFDFLVELHVVLRSELSREGEFVHVDMVRCDLLDIVLELVKRKICRSNLLAY